MTFTTHYHRRTVGMDIPLLNSTLNGVTVEAKSAQSDAHTHAQTHKHACTKTRTQAHTHVCVYELRFIFDLLIYDLCLYMNITARFNILLSC